MQDPTREELVQAYREMPFADEFSEFDFEEAVYWFADRWHGGQGSNLYSIMSTSPFHPGPITTGPEDPAQVIYDHFEATFT